MESKKDFFSIVQSLFKKDTREVTEANMKFILTNFRHLLKTSVMDFPYTLSGESFQIKYENLLANSKSTSYCLVALMSFAFENQYGWSEKHLNAKEDITFKDIRLKYPELLNQLVLSFHTLEFSETMLMGYKFSLSMSQGKPYLRSKIFAHFMEWSKICVNQGNLLFSSNFQCLILSGITDVWSAIRNLIIGNLTFIISSLKIFELQDFFIKLNVLCNDKKSSWQSKEGAISGVNLILKNFSLISEVDNFYKVYSRDSKPTVKLKFGDQIFEGFPEFIKDSLKSTFLLLAYDSQLKVREKNVKAFSSFITRCTFNEIVFFLEEIIVRLNSKRSLPNSHLLSALDNGNLFLDPYEASGLLGLCTHLVKKIPSPILISKWPYYYSTFSLYLMHPASTVRQATSDIFKFLVARECNNPMFLRLVLQELSQEWNPDIKKLIFHHYCCLKNPKESCYLAYKCQPRHSILDIKEEMLFSESWQWREGRLLTYEVILNFLLKNHIYYTFGTPNIESETKFSDQRVNCGSSFRKETNKQNNFTFRRAKSTKNHLKAHRMAKRTVSSENVSLDLSSLNVSHTSPLFLHATPPREPSQFLSNVSKTSSNGFSESNLKHHGSVKERMHKGSSFKRTQNSSNDLVFSNTSLSLLQLSFDTDKQHGKQSVYFYLSQDQKFKDHQNFLHNVADSDLQWMKTVQLETLSNLLLKVLYQTLECLNDSQWELRRMSQQFFPCIVEVIRWFDFNIIQNFWLQTDFTRSSLMTFGACQSIKLSLIHAALLKQVETSSPSFCDSDLCKKLLKQIVNQVNKNIKKWITLIKPVLNRTQCDKLSVICMEIVMVIGVLGNYPSDLMESCFSHLIMQILQLFNYSHPKIFPKQSQNESKFISSTCNFLSCCLIVEQGKTCPLQVEKYFLNEAVTSLQAFLTCTEPLLNVEILPCLCYWVVQYSEDEKLKKDLNNCIMGFVDSINKKHNVTHFISENSFKQSIASSLKIISNVIPMKCVDSSLLKTILDIYFVLSQFVVLSDFFSQFRNAMFKKMTLAKTTIRNKMVKSNSEDFKPNSFNSHEIFVFDTDSDLNVESDEDITLETHNLGLSTGGSYPSPRSLSSSEPGTVQAPNNGDNIPNSDWDSCTDDEENEKEEMSAVTSIFIQFIYKIKSRIPAEEFEEVVQHLNKLNDN